MLSIAIEPADNGLIKTLLDDNINGGGEEFESRSVYEFEGPHKRPNQIKFINDLIFDLGLDVGTELDSDLLQVKRDWGTKYVPSASELKNRIQSLEKEIDKLNKLYK